MRGRKGSKKLEKTISIQSNHKHKEYHTQEIKTNKTETISHKKKEVSRDLEKNWPGQAVNLQSNKLGF